MKISIPTHLTHIKLGLGKKNCEAKSVMNFWLIFTLQRFGHIPVLPHPIPLSITFFLLIIVSFVEMGNCDGDRRKTVNVFITGRLRNGNGIKNAVRTKAIFLLLNL
jgi:hypothetical protein